MPRDFCELAKEILNIVFDSEFFRIDSTPSMWQPNSGVEPIEFHVCYNDTRTRICDVVATHNQIQYLTMVIEPGNDLDRSIAKFKYCLLNIAETAKVSLAISKEIESTYQCSVLDYDYYLQLIINDNVNVVIMSDTVTVNESKTQDAKMVATFSSYNLALIISYLKVIEPF